MGRGNIFSVIVKLLILTMCCLAETPVRQIILTFFSYTKNIVVLYISKLPILVRRPTKNIQTFFEKSFIYILFIFYSII